MIKNDGRKVSHETLEFIRIQAVKRVKQGKESPEDVIKSYGMHRSNIYKWLALHKKGGYKALKSRKASGKPPKIGKTEKTKLKKWLIKDPRQMRFDFGLWDLKMVQELIYRKFAKKVSLVTVKRVLSSIGFTNQKPLY